MAKRKSNKSASTGEKRKTSRRSAVRRVGSKARSVSRKSGMRWGEVALAALVGYEGDKILNGTPIPGMTAGYLDKIPGMDTYIADLNASMGLPGSEIYGVAENKIAGAAALLKAAYDVVKHKKLNEQDKNILIPYAIGTVFDGPSSSSSTKQSGGWQ